MEAKKDSHGNLITMVTPNLPSMCGARWDDIPWVQSGLQDNLPNFKGYGLVGASKEFWVFSTPKGRVEIPQEQP